MPKHQFEVHYRYAAGKVIAHMPVVDFDALLRALMRIKEDGYELVGVSNLEETVQ